MNDSNRKPASNRRFSQKPNFDKPNPNKRFSQKPNFSKSTPNRHFSPKPDFEKKYSPGIKQAFALRHEKNRRKNEKFLVEGVKIIKEIISISPDIFKEVFISKSVNHNDLISLIKNKRVCYSLVTDEDIAHLSDTESHQGVIAVARFSNLKPNWSTCRYVTILDAVQDPGNVGAVIRTSFAFGVDAVILGKGCCDIYNPKVVRASAGQFLRMPFEAGVDIITKLNYLRQKGFTILATSSKASYTIDQVKKRKKVALIVSNEGSGINLQLNTMADEIVKIPMKNKVESLNVAVAHGILINALVSDRQ
ncbi:MAG: RNA methyltransferase [Fibrobacteria bacterium]|nr:RNA methyltransferase [Fibrobacteria bacterium]